MRSLTIRWQMQGREQWHLYTVTADQPCVIGREEGVCQIVIDDRSVSRQHASISAKDETFYLSNLSQTNIISFNSQYRLAQNQTTPLKIGDTFRLGVVRMWVVPSQRPTVLKVKCARCAKLVDYHPEGFCPWCGRALANGQVVEADG